MFLQTLVSQFYMKNVKIAPAPSEAPLRCNKKWNAIVTGHVKLKL